MNIDILNAYCGLGHSRGHACLRVGSKSIAMPHRRRSLRRRAFAHWASKKSGTICRPSSVGGSSVGFVALRNDPFVARRRLFRVGARTTTLLDADEQKRSRPRRRSGGLAGATGNRTTIRPEIRRDYPLNLSILISGGKETNKDSLSNGE